MAKAETARSTAFFLFDLSLRFETHRLHRNRWRQLKPIEILSAAVEPQKFVSLEIAKIRKRTKWPLAFFDRH